MKDALGNKIIIGNTYGYCQSISGITTIVKGIAEKVNENHRVTISEVEERRGGYGYIKDDFHKEPRKRSVNAIMLFPIQEEKEEKPYRIPQIIPQMFTPCFVSEEAYEAAYKTSEFWTDSGFLDAYQKYESAKCHTTDCAKIYILKNWKKIQDWTDLHLIVNHGPTGEETEYFKYVPDSRTGTYSKALADVIARMELDDQKRHNPIVSFDEVLLDPTDGDFSITINGKEHWWISNEPIIVLANYIEKNLNK
jgi:hypothetical protein